MKDTSVSPFVRFFAGDWSEIHKLLLSGNIDQQKETDETLGSEYDGYDLILMAETVYALSSLSNLYVLIKKVSVSKV